MIKINFCMNIDIDFFLEIEIGWLFLVIFDIKLNFFVL